MKTDNSALGQCEGFMAAFGSPALTVDLIDALSREILAHACPDPRRGKMILALVQSGAIEVVERTGNGPDFEPDNDDDYEPEFDWKDVEAAREKMWGKTPVSQFDEWGNPKKPQKFDPNTMG